MIELHSHIEILLLSNDCVIVPGFGGFMAHHVDARFDEADHMFLPPYRTIGFNPSLTLNDSLLAQSYVEAYDLSYPEALRRIEEEVEALRRQLDTDGYYELNGIGTIKQNIDGNYEFEPFEAGILSPEYYGLSGFQMEPLAVAHHRVASVVPVQKQQEEETPQEVEANVETEEEGEEGGHIVNLPMAWLRSAAAILIAVMTLFILPEQVGNHPMEASSTLNTGWLRKMMPSTVTYTSPSTIATIEEKTSEVPAIDKQPSSQNECPSVSPAEDVLEKETTDYYCVVLASMVSEKNGNDFIQRLAKSGFDKAELMKRPSGNKVVYGKFVSEEDAINMKRQLSRNTEARDCWVMHVKQ